ncbi:MAG: U32 family peptidase [Treponema sp.]|jgi:putative protease|nr:U32 family peptidase [Treponema sp.]
MKAPELLAPAGSPEALDAAVGEGADGVYLGLRSFNARMRSANFTYSQFEGALRSLRRMGRKLYVTVNTVFEQREADRMFQLLKYLAVLGPDGIIVQDFGVIRMVRDNFPTLKLHASTQMNIASARAVNLLSRQGVSRVVLARELSFGEIQGIRAKTNMELEVFVHGALCVSASGLCLFSGYLGGKSANRGMCTQACRRFYRQDDEGGYYFSPSDLQLLERVPLLADAGINSFKIEGRMKSAEYVGAVVSAYRRVIDGLSGDREKSLREGLDILKGDFARKKTVFYFDGSVFDGVVDWLKADQDGGTGIPLGTLLKVKGSGESRRGLIPAGTVRPYRGDSVRLHRSDDTERKAHKLTAVENADRSGLSGTGTGAGIWISIPEGFVPGDSVYLIQTHLISRRYPPVIRGTEGFRREPGRETAPEISLPSLKRAEKLPFPEGVYGAVSRFEDLFILQSVRPIRVMLQLTRKNAARLLNAAASPLPFTPREIILTLDPSFPQDRETTLEEEINKLQTKGYYQFVVNNLGHLSYFRSALQQFTQPPEPAKRAKQTIPPPALIAGPYLYQFNRWANAFAASLGLNAMISPPENNRQNLEKTVSPGRRAFTFITLFSYPALFRIRADLRNIYDFEEFRDSRDERFRLISGGMKGEGSLVIPEKPCSIVDKVPFLQEAGFRRFILDFSGPPLRKKDYRGIMNALQAGRPLPGTSRFNWKDGFYSPPPV